MDITFAQLVTPAGTVIAAGIITALVQLLKGTVPILDARVSGASMAFLISALLYIATTAALLSEGALTPPDGFLGVFLAWLSAATSAVGIKAAYDHASIASAKSLPVNDEIAPDPDIPPVDPPLDPVAPGG
jgi:hypothetical protein